MRHLPAAVSWMTVLPVPQRLLPQDVTRAGAGRIIAWVPATGAVVGAVVAGIAWLGCAAGLPTILIGALAVAAGALFTRGMHLDGFADCVDGLGSYGPPERAREIMRQGTVGPFGAAALALILLVDAAAIGALAAYGQWYGIVVAIGAARVAAVLGCRWGWSAANPDGFGALTAGTQGIVSQGFWVVAAVAAGFWAVPWTPWQGPVVVLVALLVAGLAMRHCARRFGGVSGDVYGFGIELATAIALVGFVVG